MRSSLLVSVFFRFLLNLSKLLPVGCNTHSGKGSEQTSQAGLLGAEDDVIDRIVLPNFLVIFFLAVHLSLPCPQMPYTHTLPGQSGS